MWITGGILKMKNKKPIRKWIGKGFKALAIGFLLYIPYCTFKPFWQMETQKEEGQVITKLETHTGFDGFSRGIGVALGDINRDGLDDLIVGTRYGVKYFRNVGEGRFAEYQTICDPREFAGYISSKSNIAVSLGDINGDKNLDLIVATPEIVKAYINNNGKFEEQ
jgi:hypothetical protein